MGKLITNVLITIIFLTLITCPFYFYLNSPIPNSGLKLIATYQMSYPTLDSFIKQCLSDGVVTQLEMISILEKVNELERQEIINKIENRHPLQRLKEDIKNDFEKANGES